MPSGVPMLKTIEAFKQTRWWDPTVRRFKAHIEACNALDCRDLIEPFLRFVSEVMSSPEGVRDDMLAMPELEPVAPVVRYRQYDTPRNSK